MRALHGWHERHWVSGKGYMEHPMKVLRSPRGGGYLGKGMYFSVMDSSGISAQLTCYNSRKRALCDLHIRKPAVVFDEGRKGASPSWMLRQFHEIVSTKPFTDGSDGWGCGSKYRQWLFATARRKGYDSFLYLTHHEEAGPEHGSQIAVLDTRIVEVLDWHYDPQDELRRLDNENRGW